MHGPLDKFGFQFVDLIKCVTSGTSDVQKCQVLVNHLYLQIESQICLEDHAWKAWFTSA